MTALRLSLMIWMVAVCQGFAPQQQQQQQRVTTALTARSQLDNPEISRRVALVTAAALAAGASPAHAASLEKMVLSLYKANASEVNTKGAPEKHLPAVTIDGTKVQVVVPHVMDPEKPHFIEYIWLTNVKSNQVVAVQAYSATDAAPPTLSATVAAGSTVQPMLYCNLHGLWQGDVVTV